MLAHYRQCSRPGPDLRRGRSPSRRFSGEPVLCKAGTSPPPVAARPAVRPVPPLRGGMNSADRRIELPRHVGESGVERGPPPDQHIIVAGKKRRAKREPHDFAQPPPHAVALHRIADLTRHREADPSGFLTSWPFSSPSWARAAPAARTRRQALLRPSRQP